MAFRQACIGICFAAVFGFAYPQPARAEAPSAPSPTPAPVQPPLQAAPGNPGDPFGDEVTLEAKTFVSTKGTATWEKAFETIVEAVKTINGYLDKQKIKPSGQVIVIYTETDDRGFHYQAGVPIAEAPKNPPRGDLTVGQSPGGKAVKFVHRGSYDSMDTTYEAITNRLDEKRLETQDVFIEEYVTDPIKTPADKLVVNIYVPLKQR